MRKLIKTFALVAVAALSAVGCTENMVDDSITPSTTEGITLYATTPSGDTTTKVEFSDNDGEGIVVGWELEDTFTIYDYDSYENPHTFVCTDVEKGIFTCQDITSLDPMKYDAYYNDAYHHLLTSLSEQDGDLINNLDAACKMKATFDYEEGEDVTINFQHTNAIMTFKFESAERPAYLIFENGSTEYKVTYSELEPVNGIYTSHIMVDPCAATSRTLTFSLYNSEGAAYDIRTVTTTKAYVAGYRYTSPVSDLDPTIWLGSGTETDPYQITTAQQLRDLSTSVNAGTDYLGEYFVMTGNIDLGGIDDDGTITEENEFTAIGTDSEMFCGNFDGGGYEVSGLYINATESPLNNKGLFGYINNATIKNLSVSGSVTGQAYIGGVVGYVKAPSIVYNCYNSCTVSGRSNVGGVVGRFWSPWTQDATLENCHNSGNITLTLEDSNTVGGVVGYTYTNISGTFILNNCTNTGSVVGSGLYTGGVIGEAQYTTIINCYNSGSVESSISGSTTISCAGGIVGYTKDNTTLINCYNTGAVKSLDACVGGIVGYHLSSGAVTNCYSAATLEATNSGTNTITYSGGIVGYLSESSATVSDCFYDSTLYVDDAAGYIDAGTVTNVYGYSTSFMQNSLFVSLLNNGTYTYNESDPSIAAYAWQTNDGGYPTIDVNNLATLTTTSLSELSSTNYPDSDTWNIKDENITYGGFYVCSPELVGLKEALAAAQKEGRAINVVFINLTSIPEFGFYYVFTVDNVSVELPEVVTVEGYAFNNCTSLKSISFPKLETIGTFAFSSCSSLLSLDLPAAKTIDTWACDEYSKNVTYINIPMVESIGSFAFYHCKSIETLILATESSNDVELKSAYVFDEYYTKYIDLTVGSKVSTVDVENKTWTTDYTTYTFNSITVK